MYRVRVIADFDLNEDELESFENIAGDYAVALAHPTWEESTVWGEIVDHQRVSVLKADDLVYPPPIL